MDDRLAFDPHFTAIIVRDGEWWVGWIRELTWIISQGETRAELITNLKSALVEGLEIQREKAVREAGERYEEVVIA